MATAAVGDFLGRLRAYLNARSMSNAASEDFSVTVVNPVQQTGSDVCSVAATEVEMSASSGVSDLRAPTSSQVTRVITNPSHHRDGMRQWRMRELDGTRASHHGCNMYMVILLFVIVLNLPFLVVAGYYCTFWPDMSKYNISTIACGMALALNSLFICVIGVYLSFRMLGGVCALTYFLAMITIRCLIMSCGYLVYRRRHEAFIKSRGSTYYVVLFTSGLLLTTMTWLYLVLDAYDWITLLYLWPIELLWYLGMAAFLGIIIARQRLLYLLFMTDYFASRHRPTSPAHYRLLYLLPMIYMLILTIVLELATLVVYILQYTSQTEEYDNVAKYMAGAILAVIVAVFVVALTYYVVRTAAVNTFFSDWLQNVRVLVSTSIILCVFIGIVFFTYDATYIDVADYFLMQFLVTLYVADVFFGPLLYMYKRGAEPCIPGLPPGSEGEYAYGTATSFGPRPSTSSSSRTLGGGSTDRVNLHNKAHHPGSRSMTAGTGGLQHATPIIEEITIEIDPISIATDIIADTAH